MLLHYFVVFRQLRYKKGENRYDFKSIKTNKLLTINYQNNGFVQTVKGYIQNLNLLEQTLLLKDENQHVRSLRLSSIKTFIN